MMETRETLVTRRDFVRDTVGAAAAISMLGATGATAAEEKHPARQSTVALVRDEKVLGSDNKVDVAILKKMVNETLTKCTGAKQPKEAWLSLLKPEDKIGIVATKALYPTHNELVEAITASLKEAGVPEANIQMAQNRMDLVKSSTVLICMPGLKAHWLTGMGTVLKNYIMFSGKPRDYHQADSAKLGEIWNMPDLKGKTKLVLVDALRPLCDKGPQVDPRYQWNYNGLLAGSDPVAVEAVGLKIITEKRKTPALALGPLTPLPLCVEAADTKYGLGTSKLDEIKIDHSGWDKDLLI